MAANANIDVEFTAKLVIKDAIDREALREDYKGDLLGYVRMLTEMEGLQGCTEDGYEIISAAELGASRPIDLNWGEHLRDGRSHTEWHAACGCAFHPAPYPHVHPCSDEHRRLSTQEQAIVTAAREWAKAWGKVWGGDESATDKVNNKSKTLHDAVLDLEREIVSRRRRTVMPNYDEALERWLS